MKVSSLDVAIKSFCFLFSLVRFNGKQQQKIRELYKLYLEIGHDDFEVKIKKPMELYLHNDHYSKIGRAHV